MGRLGTDVVALACIAGGAIVGAGVSAGLMARAGSSAHHEVRVSCTSTASSHVVIRLGEGDASRENVRVIAAKPCSEMVEVELDEVLERVEVARERMERARRSAEVARVQADEVRARAERARVQSIERIRLPAEESRAAAEIARDAATTARLQAMERQLEAAAARLRDLGGDDEALRAALDRLRAERERVARITASGTGGG